ncbi:short-chain dehydrogenase [Croceicoccus estronivorus]|uniref:oxidoreductase n=1 Tax=Croceicoccus estronivorus TaxID=1172626 RepID=UPI00082D12A6|nr:oxidoreductase [Croceicoccus estronivorus]OCC23112.1 short-chain dehydrogenase [Croceicoccus estronivorus]
MQGWSETDIPDLSGKRVLITGGASGIGYEAARALALHGAHVLIADRNEQGGRDAVARIQALKPGASVEFRALDLSSLESVRQFATSLVAEGGKLDILINNAGIQPISERRESADGFELTFAIGHLGHFVLTAGLWPLLLAASEPRIVTVSSMVHGRGTFDWDDLQITKGYAAQRPYNQTKLANLLFARELQRRVDLSGGKVKSIAVHPGVAQTSIGSNRKQLGKFRLGDHLISVILRFVMPYLGQPASAGALPTMYAASAPDAQGGGFYGPQGGGEMKGPPGSAKIKPAGQDMAVARKLWDVTEELTGVTFL